MGNKTDRMHFIPKVYLRKWILPGQSHLYSYNYREKEFYKDWNKEELGLNCQLFQDHRIYSQEFEGELQSIENNYNDWLNGIEHFFQEIIRVNQTGKSIPQSEFQNGLYKNFHNNCLRMVYFCFVQWIRHPNIELRSLLFKIFKEFLLSDTAEYFMLNSSEYIEFQSGAIIGIQFEKDRELFRNPFALIDSSKLNNYKNIKYQIFIDYCSNGSFVTSTRPVTPMFGKSSSVPIGLTFPLSRNYVLRIMEKGPVLKHHGDEDYFPCQWAIAGASDVERLNRTQFLNDPSAMVIIGEKLSAETLFKGLNMSQFESLQKLVVQKVHEYHKSIVSD